MISSVIAGLQPVYGCGKALQGINNLASIFIKKAYKAFYFTRSSPSPQSLLI